MHAEQAREPGEIAAALETALAEVLPAPVRVEGIERLTGGATRETWSFEATDGEGAEHALILRRDFPEGGSSNPDALAGRDDVLDRAGELELQRALHEIGIPVPRCVLLPPPGRGLEEAYVMERVEGESRPRALARKPELEEVRELLVEDLGDLLAQLATLDPTGLPALPERPVEVQLQICRALLDRSPEPRPALELGLRWCRERAAAHPEPQPRLVHGDFRNGNLIAGPDGLHAVIDWEYAHLGDPAEDLAFLCLRPWRFGADEREVGGLGDRDDLYRTYEEAGGQPVEADRVRFWEVMGNLKWGALCGARAVDHLDGMQRSVELAAIGRRVAEAEHDLLELVD